MSKKEKVKWKKLRIKIEERMKEKADEKEVIIERKLSRNRN